MKMESPASVSELHDGLRQRSYQQADTEQVKASYEQLRCPRNDTATSSMDDIYYRSRNDYRWKDGAPSIAYMLQTTAGGTTTGGRTVPPLQTTETRAGGTTTGGGRSSLRTDYRDYGQRDDYRRKYARHTTVLATTAVINVIRIILVTGLRLGATRRCLPWEFRLWDVNVWNKG